MTPQLRFPEFTDVWQVKKLGDIGSVITGSTPSTTDRTLYGSEYQFISPGDMNSGRYVISTKQRLSQKGFDISRKIKRGSTLFVCIGSTIGKTAQVREMSVTNQQINAVVTNDNHDDDFVYLALSKISTKIALSAGAQAVPIISKSDFSKNIIHIPSKPEQEKIADFLTAVDERIGVGEKKLELLETYKRGVMQKIFSQQVRFKDDNGNPYPDWEEKRLGNQLIEGSKVPVNDTSEYRKITIGLNKSGVRGADLSRKMADTRPFYVRTANEIIIGKQNYFNGSIAIIPETFDGTICSNAIMSFKVNAQNSTKFIYEAISSRDFLKRREALANGTGQKELSESEFMNFKVLLPCIEEQQKIADFLTTLDDKITAEKSKLTATRQFKKALLQRMFV